MDDSKIRASISIKVEPEFMEEIKDAAKKTFGGKVAMFSRDAIKTSLELRRLYGPRYNVVISELIDGAEAEKALAA